jgi:hypothetical protein
MTGSSLTRRRKRPPALAEVSRRLKRQWFRSAIGLVLVVAAVFVAPGAASRMQAARIEQTATPSHAASAETTFTVSVMRSFEVDMPAAPSDPVAVRSNGGGGYTRRLTEVHRLPSPPGSGDGAASETLVYVYVITPNY